MTFSKLVTDNVIKYGNRSVILHFVYSMSKKVNSIEDFAMNCHKEIDFSIFKFNSAVKRYFIKQQPMGYITKKVHFLNTMIITKKNVLIPRNETEELTQKVIDLINVNNITKVADLCCGTGCIGIAIANNSKANVTSVDISKKCINLTKKNAMLNKVKISVIKGDYFKSIYDGKMKFECIVCNPPYVALNELDKNMLKYEPKIAFNNGNEYSFYKMIIENFKDVTTDKFIIAFEIGHNQKQELTTILQNNNLLKFSKFYQDINGKDRMLIISNY